MPRRPSLPATLAAGTLALAGLLHLAWASGSHLPAPDEASLARAVTGASTMPPAIASAAVGIAMLLAAALTLLTRRHRVLAWLAGAMAAVLLARALVPVDVLMAALGLEEPGTEFRSADLTVFRPLCAALAALVALELVLGRRAR